MIHDKTKTGPVTMLVTYKAKAGHEDALLALVKKHWPELRRLGLAAEEPARIWKTRDRQGKVAFVELFAWKDGKASEVAHQTPEVMAIWEPMGAVMEGLDIAEAEPVDLG